MLMNTRRIYTIAVSSIMALCSVMSCSKPEEIETIVPDKPVDKTVKVESVGLDKSDITLVEGSSAKLTATVLPENATDKSVKWSSSDAAVVSVDENGNLAALKPGSATITVTTTDGGKTASCTVSVDPEKVKAISIEPSTLTMKEGETHQLEAKTSKGEKVTDLIWSSSNGSAARVDENGLVTAVSAGKTRVRATLRDDHDVEAVCEITVEQDKSLKSIALSSEMLELSIGDTKVLEVIFTPSYAENKNVSWSSSDASVAEVDAGKVTAKAAGKAIIKATSEEGGFTASCEVTVVSSATASKGLYWADENRWLYFNDSALSEYANLYSVFAICVDGQDVYTMHSLYDYHYGTLPTVYKNNVKVNHDPITYYLKRYYNKYIEFRNMQVVNGKVYLTGSVRDCSYLSLVTVDMASGKVEEKEFFPETPYNSFGVGSEQMVVSSNGTVYIAAEFTDEFKEESSRLWTIKPDGKVEEKIFYKAVGDMTGTKIIGLDINESGDVFCLVGTHMYVGNGFTDVAHLYKNGKELFSYDDPVDHEGFAVSGNDVYYSACVPSRDKVLIYKNKELYNTVTGSDIYPGGQRSIVLSKSGDLYYIINGSSRSWIYKNKSVFHYRSSGYINGLYLVE